MGSSGSSLRELRIKGYLRGMERMGDIDLLSLVLGNRGGCSGGMTAQRLFDRFGGLRDIEKTGVKELMGIMGIGRVAAIRLKASFELGRRCLISVKEKEIRRISSPADVAELMIPEMSSFDREHFRALLLNTRNGILKIVTVAVGSLNAALVHPREIFKEAVISSSAGIIVVHNHPTGDPEPSCEDKDLTERFARCGKLMGIELIDHVIIGGTDFVSMKERGFISF
ncbi:MAG: DNA repair protein RadC [Candidatus Krumholzibacteriota bacterium]|nr:DNA repair protein RadC [Candidatus Krumholzibacteriota bacterium]